MIKAIETSYRGYRFRSRLEARWAVTLDHLGIPWEYEAEGYNLDHVLTNRKGTFAYLPDFWLPGLEMFGEVKGDLTEDGLVRLCESAAALTPLGPTLIMGPMGEIDTIYDHGYLPWLMRAEGAEVTTVPWDPIDRSWLTPGVIAHRSSNVVSRWVSIRGGIRSGRWSSETQEWPQAKEQLLRGGQDMPINRQWAKALAAGQQARFEHGESPRPAVR